MPYKDPEVRRRYKHEHYTRNRDKVLRRVKEYNRTHPEVHKRADHKYNQRKNAPYHEIADEAGLSRVCVECGSVESLGIHHIDGDHYNNAIDNLQWMCVSCHAKLHAARRRGSGPSETLGGTSEALSDSGRALGPDGRGEGAGEAPVASAEVVA